MSRLGASSVLLATILLTACGGGDASGPEPTSQTLGIALDTGAVAVQQGNSTTISVSITRTGGYSGSVSLQVEGTPGNVTISFAPHPVSGAGNGCTMTIAVGSSATVGRYLMTVRATASGVNQASAPLWLDIMEPADYRLVLARDTVGVIQGSTGQVDVNITRVSGFAGAVTLALEGAPAGVTATFDPNPTSSSRSTLSLGVGGAVAAGRYTVTVKGTSTGLPQHGATFVLDVLDSGTAGFTLALAPAAVTVVSGGNVTATLTIHRTGGFAGAVTVDVAGQPTGVTWSTNPHSTTGDSVTLTFVAGITVTAGSYTLTVTGSATGYTARQASLQLTVQETAGFWVQLMPATVSTAPGAAAQTVSVVITRTGGFSDTVHLSMTGLPDGLTATFNPAATPGNASLVIAATSAAAGTYTGTLHATAAGMLERTTTLSVTVLSVATNIVWRFCGSAPAPVLFAVQDGYSPWVAVAPASDGSYAIGVAAGRGAVTMVVPGLPDTATGMGTRGGVAAMLPQQPGSASASSSGYTTYTYYGSTAELQALAQAQCAATTKTVSGTVAGVAADQAWAVGLGGDSAIGLPGAATGFTLRDVLPGSHDLLAARAPFTDTETLPNAFVIRRDLAPADGSTLPVIDFNGAEAFASATGTLTVSGIVGTSFNQVILGFSSANGSSTLIGQRGAVTNGSLQVAGVPADRLRAGDLHSAALTVDAQNPPLELSATLFAARLGTWSVTIAEPPLTPTVDVYTITPQVRLRARCVTGGPGAAYDGLIRVSFIQAATQRAAVVYQSRAFNGTSGNFEIRTGGYGTLPGWDEATYGFRVGTPASYSVELNSGGYVFQPADGSVRHALRVTGELTP